MSLIPSESYSFPDHFTRTVAGSRKPQNIEPEPEPEEQFVEPPRKKPALIALPNPKPQPPSRPPLAQRPQPVVAKENPKPARKIAPPIPNPALRRASATPPRIPDAPIRKLALPASLKPKVRWNNRAPAINPAPIANNGESNGNGNGAAHLPYEPVMPPAENVIQMKPQLPAARPPREIPRLPKIPAPPPVPRPIPVAPRMPNPAAFAPPQEPVPSARPAQPAVPREKPRPITPAKVQPPPMRESARPVAPAPIKPPMRPAPRPVVASNPQGDFFEDFAQTGETAVAKRRRKAKMRRFVICESIAVGVLLPLAILGLAHHPENVTLVWIVNISTIASAVAAALIPILFFALTPTLPAIEQ